MRRGTTMLLAMAVMVAVMAMPAFAGTFAGDGANFGQCAAGAARSFQPGPEHGNNQSLASEYNPSGGSFNFQCAKDVLPD